MGARYTIARRDFETLENIAPLDDQVELDAERKALMETPTKAKAADMYETGIRLWFTEHRRLHAHDPDAQDIADRHGLSSRKQGG